ECPPFNLADSIQGLTWSAEKGWNLPDRRGIATLLARERMADFLYGEERRVMGALRTVALLAATGMLVIPTEPSVSNPSALFASERFCLAEAIYFEARGEPAVGQMAVGRVIMNRTKSAHYPHTICGVVNQNADLLNRCQFSYRCDGKIDMISEWEPWQESL